MGVNFGSEESGEPIGSTPRPRQERRSTDRICRGNRDCQATIKE